MNSGIYDNDHFNPPKTMAGLAFDIISGISAVVIAFTVPFLVIALPFVLLYIFLR